RRNGDRGMAVQRLRGRLSRDWLFPRKTVIAFALGLAALGGSVELALDPPRSIMGVDIADQINYDPAAYEASVGATALDIVRIEEDDPGGIAGPWATESAGRLDADTRPHGTRGLCSLAD